MQAIYKESIVVNIYKVRNDKCGYPMFLIFYNNQWFWKSAKHFKPYKNTDDNKGCCNCRNNVSNPKPHTCDICTSLDNKENFVSGMQLYSKRDI